MLARVSASPVISLAVEGAVATAVLSRPPVNAIDEGWLSRLDELVGRVEGSPELSVLVIRSSERAFCAGADLELMRSRFQSSEGRSKMIAFVREIQRVYARIERLPQVVLAEIGGAALGGGLELALACDLRIASDEARLGLPEAGLGLLPGAGGTQRLTRLAGEANAKRLILRGEIVSGAQATGLGLVHWAVPGAELRERSLALAGELAALPLAALAACKRCIGAARDNDPRGYELEIEGTAALLADRETQRRVREFFAKRS